MQLVAVLCALLFALPAWAEEGWEQVYLSEPEALKVIFPGTVTVERRQVAVTPAQRTALERHLGRRLPEESYTFFVGRKGGQVDGYGLILDEIGKHDPITFIVGMNADLTVREVAVMVFRERRGDGVRRRRFLNQFPGRSAKDTLMLNRDILPITGSTMSSAAVTAGVKRALATTRFLLLGKPL